MFDHSDLNIHLHSCVPWSLITPWRYHPQPLLSLALVCCPCPVHTTATLVAKGIHCVIVYQGPSCTYVITLQIIWLIDKLRVKQIKNPYVSYKKNCRSSLLMVFKKLFYEVFPIEKNRKICSQNYEKAHLVLLFNIIIGVKKFTVIL